MMCVSLQSVTTERVDSYMRALLTMAPSYRLGMGNYCTCRGTATTNITEVSFIIHLRIISFNHIPL